MIDNSIDYAAAKKTIVGEWDLDKNSIIENNRDKLNENQVKDIEKIKELIQNDELEKALNELDNLLKDNN